MKINKDTIFVFDLHGVIFKLDPIQVVKEAIFLPNKLKFMSVALYPGFVIKAFYSLLQGAVAEKVVLTFDKKFPNLEFIKHGLRVLNSQKPINGTVEIIKDLKNAGYKVYVLSNIGEHSLKILHNKYPEVFCNFDGFTGTSQEDDYVQKPNIIAFEKYLAKFGHEKSKLVFIDDQMKNVHAARNFGLKAIQFKSPRKLKKELVNLNVFNKK